MQRRSPHAWKKIALHMMQGIPEGLAPSCCLEVPELGCEGRLCVSEDEDDLWAGSAGLLLCDTRASCTGRRFGIQQPGSGSLRPESFQLTDCAAYACTSCATLHHVAYAGGACSTSRDGERLTG